MLYRSAACVIVAFWLVMTGLLVRTELWPEQSALRSVPLAHVFGTLWQHEQPSELIIGTAASPRVGRIMIHPRTTPEGARRLDINGGLLLYGLDEQRQRIEWTLGLDYDDSFRLLRGEASFTVHRGAAFVARAAFDRATGRAWYESPLVDDGFSQRREFTLDEAGFQMLLRDLGIDPGQLTALWGQAAVTTPSVGAQRAALLVRGEKIETFLLSARSGGTTYFEAHFSKLGRILRGKALLGYILEAEDNLP